MRIFLLIFMLITLTGSGVHAQTRGAGANSKTAANVKDWVSLLDAERGFAALCAKEGIGPSFLANFSGDVLTFPSGATIAVGTKDLQAMPPSQTLLTWQPAKVEVARSGDWGYTTGPYQSRAHLISDPVTDSGSYVTIWTKDKTGAWKAALDMGADCPGQYAPIALKCAPQDPLPANLRLFIPDVLRAADQRLFAQADLKDGSGYSAMLAPDIILYRNNAYPIYGITAAIAVLQAHAATEVGGAKYATIAESGDYGFTAGSVKETNVRTAQLPYNYVHIWRITAAGDWHLVLEMTNDGTP